MYASSPHILTKSTRTFSVQGAAASSRAQRTFGAGRSVDLSTRKLTPGIDVLKSRRYSARVARKQSLCVRAEKVVGIDLGTTNSAVSFYAERALRCVNVEENILHFSLNSRYLPTYIFCSTGCRNGRWLSHYSYKC